MKKFLLISSMIICSLFLLTGCGGKEEIQKPTDLVIEEGIKTALKEDEHINFDKMSNFTYTEVEVTEDDFTKLKETFASRVEYIKYETTFSLVSVNMDMEANYSAIFVYNNGEWYFSFGYVTDKDAWTYQEKEASRVDKQRMLSDLKEKEFASFEQGYVGNPKYSSIKSIDSREYDESVHRDTIKTSVGVKTDFAEYDIPITMIYYFQKGEWILGDVSISGVEEWTLKYNDNSAPEFLDNSIILSYLTTDTNFLTYVCNLNYVDNYEIVKESEIASKDSVDVVYKFSAIYDYIGTVNYDVTVSYQWLNNEWSDAEPVVTFRDADFSEFIKYDWNSEDGSYFKFTNIESLENGIYRITGKYSNNNSVDIVCNLTVPLRDNNWEAQITDINGNQIWDIPSSSFSLNLEYGAIIYNDIYFAPINITISEDPIEDIPEVNTSNEIAYTGEDIVCTNEITKENLLFKEISISYNDNSLNISGTIYNLSDGQTGYKISAALFDKNGMIISEGVLNSDSQLTANSSAIVSLKIDDITEDMKSNISKITIYLKK